MNNIQRPKRKNLEERTLSSEMIAEIRGVSEKVPGVPILEDHIERN